MSTPTTTIRVPVQTRDRLAAQARHRGVSLATLLTEFATRAERDAIFSAERDATRSDAAIHGSREEDDDWDDAIGDGVA
jgi:hypothetical protein